MHMDPQRQKVYEALTLIRMINLDLEPLDMKKAILGLAAALCALSSPANAAVKIQVEGGGNPVVWEDNGNRFALLGPDARGTSGGLVDLDYINSVIVSGPLAINLFVCVGGFPCASPASSVFVQDGERLFDSLIAEFDATAGAVVFEGTSTLNLNPEPLQLGPPPIGGAIPEPATWLMLILGFFGVGAAMRSKGAAGAGRREAFA